MKYSSRIADRVSRIAFTMLLAVLLASVASLALADEPNLWNKPGNSNDANDGTDRPLPYVQGQVVVKFQSAGLAASFGGSDLLYAVRAQLSHSNVYLFEVRSDMDAMDAANTIAAMSGVEYAHPNYLLSAVHPVQASYPFSDLQATGDYYGQDAAVTLGLSTVHTMGSGNGTTVGIIDGGVDNTHPYLSGSVSPGHDFVDGDLSAFDEPGGQASGHGTFVAGIVHLMAPDAVIRPYRVMNPDGYGDGFTLARSIERAVDDGCGIINLSLILQKRHLAVTDALKYAEQHGVVVAAASGNHGSDIASYPAAEREAMAIAAIDSNSYLADFSDYGSHVALCAPGTAIYSAYLSHYNAWWSGTSFATPFVSGLAAVLASIAPEATASQIQKAMTTSAVDLDSMNPSKAGKLGFGIIDPYAAALLISSIETADVTPDTIRVTFPVDFMPIVIPTDSVYLSSTNAPAAYTMTITDDGNPFLFPFDTLGTGTTNDLVKFYIVPIPEAGVYSSTMEFDVAGTIEPVFVTVIQTVTHPDSQQYAWAQPSSFYIRTHLGEPGIYSRGLLLRSNFEPANFSVQVFSGPTPLTTVLNATGSTPDTVRIEIEPGLASAPGFYTDSISVNVAGADYPLLVPVFVEILDTVGTADTAWVYPDTGLTLYAYDLDTLWACMFVHSSNAPASYTVDYASPPKFVSLMKTSGTTPDSVCFIGSGGGLAPGIYADTLLFYVDGAANSPVPAIVRLVVDSAGGGDTTMVLCPDLRIDNVVPQPDSHAEVVVRNAGPASPWGGFDLLMKYDPSKVEFIGYVVGDFAYYCGWEYFSVTCDSNFIRVTSVADLSSVPGSPTCLTPDSNMALVFLEFMITGVDSSSGCTDVPVRFWWNDCGDNTISNSAGDKVWIAGQSPYSVVDHNGADLTGLALIGGPPHPCGTVSGSPQACATFKSGSIRVNCDTPFDTTYALPTALYFTATEGSTATQTGTFGIYSTNAPAAYVAYVADSLHTFVTIPDSTGFTNDSIAVVVDPTGLSQGLHVATVHVAVDNILSPAVMNVYLTIEASQGDAPPPALALDYVTGYLGDTVSMSLRSMSSTSEWGGFELWFEYDSNALTLVSSDVGPFFGACASSQTQRGDAITNDTALFFFTAIFDCAPPDSGDVLLTMNFEVTSDTMWACKWAPVRFWWGTGDCGDNAISNTAGDSLMIAASTPGSVIDYDGTDITGVPRLGGPDSSCAWFAGVYDIVKFRNGAVEINCSGGPDSVKVAGLNNYPNPFNPQTEIEFSLAADAMVRLDLYNILGQRVTTLIDGPLAAGKHAVVWTGRHGDGREAASGVYFARLVVGADVFTRKLLLLR